MDSRNHLSTLQIVYWNINLKIFFKHIRALWPAYLGVLSKYGQAERRTVRQMFEMECGAIKISLARNFVTALEHVQGNNIRGLGVP